MVVRSITMKFVFLPALLAFLSAVLLILAYVRPLAAAETRDRSYLPGEMSTLNGELLRVDNATNTLTLRSDQLGADEKRPGELNVFVNDQTRIMACTQSTGIGELKPDRDVTISYQEIGGVPVARDVTEKC